MRAVYLLLEMSSLQRRRQCGSAGPRSLIPLLRMWLCPRSRSVSAEYSRTCCESTKAPPVSIEFPLRSRWVSAGQAPRAGARAVTPESRRLLRARSRTHKSRQSSRVGRSLRMPSGRMSLRRSLRCVRAVQARSASATMLAPAGPRLPLLRISRRRSPRQRGMTQPRPCTCGERQSRLSVVMRARAASVWMCCRTSAHFAEVGPGGANQ